MQGTGADFRVENLKPGVEYTFDVRSIDKTVGTPKSASIKAGTKSYADALAGRWHAAPLQRVQRANTRDVQQTYELNADGTYKMTEPPSPDYVAGNWSVEKQSLVFFKSSLYTESSGSSNLKNTKKGASRWVPDGNPWDFSVEIVSISKDKIMLQTKQSGQWVWTR